MRSCCAWLVMAVFVAAAHADEAAREAAESPAAESELPSADDIDAQIGEIERGVSGADEVEEFIPKKPLSADKATSLPSDI